MVHYVDLPKRSKGDRRWMRAALRLADVGRGTTAPNPNVGCVIVADGKVVGSGWTQPGGRPHAEAMALRDAGHASKGATVYVTLEPCAHRNGRGPCCSDLLIEAQPDRVVVGSTDPDIRTAGRGLARLEAAGITVSRDVLSLQARESMEGFFTRKSVGRPHVTLKLAVSLDGFIARTDGESQWITGSEARAHTHLQRSRHEAILVGRKTWDEDRPRLDVRLPGLESRSPRRLILTRRPDQISDHGGSWAAITKPDEIASLEGIDHVLVEGGAGAASAFIKADLVDRILLYRAPILLGEGKSALKDIGLSRLEDAHDRWRFVRSTNLGVDRLDILVRVRRGLEL